MTDLTHRVRVFVFGYRDGRPDYLLLRRDCNPESFWTPLHGRLGFDEQLESAVQREVHAGTGLSRLGEVIDLRMTHDLLLGDEQVIEWTYAARVFDTPEPEQLQATWAAHRWSDFEQAYQALEFEVDRASILRLHTLLRAA